jgi:hypothetical protein
MITKLSFGNDDTHWLAGGCGTPNAVPGSVQRSAHAPYPHPSERSNCRGYNSKRRTSSCYWLAFLPYTILFGILFWFDLLLVFLSHRGGSWFTSDSHFQGLIEPACGTGNWAGVYITNSNGTWNDAELFDYK